MYFKDKITLIGSESIAVSTFEVYRELIYNDLEYELNYAENYKVDSGIEASLICVKRDGQSNELFKYSYKDNNVKAIDTDNLPEYWIYFNNSESIPSAVTIVKEKPVEVKLLGNDDTEKEFTLVPADDGIMVHLKDTILYGKRFSDKDIDKKNKFIPIFCKDNMFMKYIYTNGLLINKDYQDKSIWILGSDFKEYLNIKYEEVDFITKGNYKISKWIPVKAKGKYFKEIIYTTDSEKRYIISGTNNNDFCSEGDIHAYNILYPIHYASILGNIFVDDDQYIICANEEYQMVKDRIVFYKIEYHKIEKEFYNDYIKDNTKE